VSQLGAAWGAVTMIYTGHSGLWPTQSLVQVVPGVIILGGKAAGI